MSDLSRLHASRTRFYGPLVDSKEFAPLKPGGRDRAADRDRAAGRGRQQPGRRLGTLRPPLTEKIRPEAFRGHQLELTGSLPAARSRKRQR